MSKWLLPLIVGLAFLLRVINLSGLPAGFTPDEASFGYDAYSILKTGKDQWGMSLPLVFRSFGDFKLPVYTYLAIPSVAIFGLNEFAVRLPNAIVGTGAVLVTYYLAFQISRNKRVSLLSAFLLAISPWHIPLSRGAFEANLTTFFLPLGILFFLNGLKKHKLLTFSAIVFGLNLFTYHAARILTPLIVGYLFFANWESLKNKKFVIVPTFIFSVFFLVAVFFYTIGGSRLASSSIFSLVGDWAGNDRYSAVIAGEPNMLAQVFNNKFVYAGLTITKNYLSYFSPQFLFTNGPAEGTYGMVPGIGVLYFFEVIFLVGFLLSLRRKITKETLLIVFWVLISPLPAAITSGPGYAANRAAFMMPGIQILLSLGALYLVEYFSERFSRKKINIIFICFTLFSLVNIFLFADKYIYEQRVQQAPSMIFGVRQLMDFDESKYEKVIISKSISEPQIYVAFYKLIDPNLTQQESKNWLDYDKNNLGWVDRQDNYKLGKYVFKTIDKITDFKLKNSLVIGKEEEFPVEIKPTKIFYYPNGKVAYVTYENH